MLAELARRSLVPEIWLPDPRVMPATNQVELQPVLHAQTLRDFHAANGIVSQAWSPLSGVNRYLPADAREFKNPLEHPTIVELASPYAKMPAQVLLRWHLERASP